MSIQIINITEKELATLIRKAPFVEVSFGPSGAWFKYDDSKPMPAALRHLLLMRGVLNENMDGAGV